MTLSNVNEDFPVLEGSMQIRLSSKVFISHQHERGWDW